MAMRRYPIQGYGIGIDWEDEERIYNLITMVDYNKYVCGEITLTGDEDEDRNTILEYFYYDPDSFLSFITEEINEEMFKRYPNEKYGIGYDTSHDKMIFIMFHDVKYGTQPGLTLEEVNKIVEALAKAIFKLPDHYGFPMIYDEIISKKGMYGNIFETYVG